MKEGDKTERLDALIQMAAELLEMRDQYTASSVQNLEKALEVAKAASENSQASEQEMNAAYERLAEAMTALERKANKTELKNALAQANKILENAGRYLEESIAGLQAVTDQAQEVYDREEKDKTAIGAALQNLVEEILKARLMGDVDINGTVDTADSAEVLKYAAELSTFSEEQSKLADMNQDGIADSKDAASVLKYAAEK